MAILFRNNQADPLSYPEMDENLGQFYVSSSINGNTINFYNEGTGSGAGASYTHSLYIEPTTGSLLLTASLSGTNLQFTKGDSSTFNVDLSSFLDDTQVSTSSLLLTASLIGTDLQFTKGDSTTFSVDFSSFLDDTQVSTASLMVTGSLSGTNLQFVKGDSSTFDIDLSSFIDDTQVSTGSLLVTGSITNNTLTFTKGDGTSFDLTVNTGSDDKEVTITGENITVNGTYPNFQITGSDVSTDVTLSGTPDYITISGQVITRNQIDLTTDVTGILPVSNMAATALTTIQTAANEAAQLGLTVQEGDVVVRTDESKTYMHNGGTAGDMSDFTLLATPTDSVTSVNGNTGAVTVVEDETVEILGKNIEVNGIYPNFQITGSTDTIYTLPEATATTRGGIELFSDTDQSVAANAVSSTAGRTYGLQLNADGQAVVNVPWVNTDTDTNTTYSISAETVSGGANLRLTDSGAGTDDVKIAGSGATTVTRTDANTITISSTDNNTEYTAGDGLGLSGLAFSLDTPGTLNKTSTNAVTANSHTHAITTTVTGTANTIVSTDATSEITAANFVTTSDRRLKSEIVPIANGLDIIKSLISYEYVKGGQKEAGFIAQEVQGVLPYAVREGEDGYLKMTDRAILAHLHNAVIQLEARLAIIEEKL